MISALIVTLLLLSAGSIIFFTLKNHVGPNPSSPKVQAALYPLLPELPENAQIAELGCAWGTLLFELAKKYPTAQITAYENSWIPYLFCLMRKQFSPWKNVHIKRKNFLKEDLSSFHLMTLYTCPQVMKKLEYKLQQEPQSSSSCWILSHTFALPGRQAISSSQADDLYRSKIYLYKI